MSPFFKLKNNNLTQKTSCNWKVRNFYIVTQKEGHHNMYLFDAWPSFP